MLRSGRTFAIDADGGEGLVALFINSETTEFMVQIVMEAVKPFLLPEEIKGEPQAHKTVLSWWGGFDQFNLSPINKLPILLLKNKSKQTHT